VKQSLWRSQGGRPSSLPPSLPPSLTEFCYSSKGQKVSFPLPAPPPLQSPGYLRHHLEKISTDEQISKLESEVASLNPASVKSSKSASSARGNSADPCARRPHPTQQEQEKGQRSQSASRASRSVTSGRANFQQVSSRRHNG
jgi:hypothetical protein